MRAQCSISLNKDPSLNKLPNIPTAFSLAVSHSDPYTHNTLPTHHKVYLKRLDICKICLPTTRFFIAIVIIEKYPP